MTANRSITDTAPPLVGDELAGFVVQAVDALPGQRLTACRLEHEATGARLLHLACEDEENLFSVSFPTPPPDDTGLPHILEHVVLSGSRNYPVRDPFFELVKMSMATFLNAMTGYDCTYYPVCSNVAQDLFNLARVYLDAVFHPLLSEAGFRQEGHRLAVTPAGELTVQGVVYNEMRSAFSDPETRLCRALVRDLFPDTPYGKESGGDPEHIPELTYERFLAFHAAHYHPGNAYFVTYGNIATADYAAFVSERLEPFERRPPVPPPPFQPRWNAPRRIEEAYPCAPGQDASNKTYLAVNWLAGDGTSADDEAAMYVLGLILLGHDGAPLKKAVIDSGLGEDIFYAGYHSVGLEGDFVVALRGSEPDRLDSFRALVLKILAGCGDALRDERRVEPAFQQAAYHFREVKSHHPLHLAESVLRAWIYGADPLAFVRMPERLAALRSRWRRRPGCFADLVRERLLDNPHRLELVLRPDPGFQARQDAAWKARLARIRSGLSEEQVAEIARRDAALQEAAGTPNPPEALATLPQLSLADLPRHPLHIATAVESPGKGGPALLVNDVFANGVNYLHLHLDLRDIDAELQPFVPRLAETWTKLGAAGQPYHDIAQRMAAATGGVRCTAGYSTGRSAGDPVWGLHLSLKALDDQVPAALELLQDLLFHPDPRDPARLREVLVQSRSGLRTDLLQEGAATAVRHAGRLLSPEGHLSELTSGPPQVALLADLTGHFDDRYEALADAVERLARQVLHPGRITASFTGSPACAGRVKDALAAWCGEMSGSPPAGAAAAPEAGAGPLREGLAAPVDVAYCAQVVPAPHDSHPDAASLAVGTQLLAVDYLMTEIRFKGNAYGALCSYEGPLSRLTFGSYADPHVTRTLGVLAGLRDYVARAAWSRVELERAVISTAKYGRRPIRPGEATGRALRRYLAGHTREVMEERYAALLSVSVPGVRGALLETLDRGQPCAPVCVMASREKLERANAELPEALAIEDLPV